jgi:hypothetical protein
VALGVAGGYLLGRTKKMKLALMLAGMAAGRRAGGPGELLKGGTKLLSSTPELARLTDQVRGRLLDAGKSAALAVAARQVESLTDRVGRRVESLGDAGLPRQRRSDEAADEPAERDEYDDEPPADDDRADDRADDRDGDRDGDRDRDDDRDDRRDEAPADEEAPASRRRPARARAAKSSGGTTTVRRTTGGAARAAGGAGKAATGGRTQRKPRTRRSEGDG